MRLQFIKALFLLMVLISFNSRAGIEVHQFTSQEQEQQYRKLIEELRCLVCQNQNLAESDAELAQDLRKEIYQMLQRGADDKEIIQFMVSRYGDFVLYRPPFKSSTLFLWLGPFIMLLLAILFLVVFIRNRKSTDKITIEDVERKKLDSLLNKKHENDKS